MDETKVSISGLTKYDVLELQGTPGIEFEEVKIPEGAQGELTLLTAAFAMSALSTLAAFLLRKHDGASFEETVVIRKPDGQTEERHVKWKRDSSSAPEADIIRQIRGSVI